jgi:hypothetical protein
VSARSAAQSISFANAIFEKKKSPPAGYSTSANDDDRKDAVILSSLISLRVETRRIYVLLILLFPQHYAGDFLILVCAYEKCGKEKSLSKQKSAETATKIISHHNTTKQKTPISRDHNTIAHVTSIF